MRWYQNGRFMLARLEQDSDLLEEIQGLAQETGMMMGEFFAIGALTEARLAFYDQSERTYRSVCMDGPLEMISCQGNLSLKEGSPFIHAHVVLGKPDFTLIGGHLLAARVFAAEVHLQSLQGTPMERKYDLGTGLYLWDAA